ncbi:MAG: Valine--tRNA ligase [Verrucomicrobia subdivision 3 bacterium]|nr:Valine--tRNA ligase [Limisphaerales bacterium]MCS1414696.1 Valine--tRNA ligase [Limisphaerales bacterium]
MSDIPKTYEPQTFEPKWYQRWLDQEIFKADAASDRPPYSIVIPPPNITGVLHMGHVLNNTIQDILARKARMDGFEVLWLPGTDHAGIATQVVVEKHLKKEQGLSRHDLGREKFVEKVWQWKKKHGGIIIEQLKKLGCSCDWSRERFTMDETYSRTVAETFVSLYHKGLIYRGKRMVNWCPTSRTALSDEEVIMKEQKGLLYYFKVEIEEEPGTFLPIATTRPETIPGDSGIAVNPQDPRYAKYIGKHVLRPLPPELSNEEKRIPIVADEHVDFEFGTGVLKVTPAHDKADFEIGERHSLAVIEVIDAAGNMNDAAGNDLKGMDRFKARKVASLLLDELGLLEKEEAYTNNVGFSERADVPIEPRLSEQWFMKYPSVAKAREIVASGEIKLYPERWKKVYDHWMANLQDWCISRQLWWGHQIPVWYRGDEVKCQVDAPGDDWTQDPDVLDTWCSSWLWPFATMDGPTLKKFYPTTALVTAPEILFFWVARMIMAGLDYRNEKPFGTVCLHGIIRDKQGRKMSKSLGNSPDPLDLIAKYGADALRLGVMRSTPRGQDTLFDEQNVELGRNFCNKLWNACRFRQMQDGAAKGKLDETLLSPSDKWILLKLGQAIDEVTKFIEEFKLNGATASLYRFFWSEYCDWYVEASKAVLQGSDERRKANTLAVIDFVLSNTLRLLHPFLPFITEELWQGMGFAGELPEGQGGVTIMNARWPKGLDQDFRDCYGLDDCYLEFVDAKYMLVREGRNLRAEAGIPSNKKVRFVMKNSRDILDHDADVLRMLLNAESLEFNPEFEAPQGTPNVHSELGDLFLPLEGLVDFEAEVARLTKEVEKIQKEIDKAEAKLGNPNFADKAPAKVVEEHRKRLQEWTERLAHTEKNLVAAQAALN